MIVPTVPPQPVTAAWSKVVTASLKVKVMTWVCPAFRLVDAADTVIVGAVVSLVLVSPVPAALLLARKSVVEGKSVDLGGSRIIDKKVSTLPDGVDVAVEWVVSVWPIVPRLPA